MKIVFIIPLLFLLAVIPVSAYWNPIFGEGNCLNITNMDNVPIPINTTLNFSMNTAALISAGKLQSGCQDLRLIRNDNTEINFTIGAQHFGNKPCNNAATSIAFRIPAAIPASSVNTEYCMYYKNTNATRTFGDNRTAYEPVPQYPSDYKATFDYGYTADEGNRNDYDTYIFNPLTANKFARIHIEMGNTGGCAENAGSAAIFKNTSGYALGGINCTSCVDDTPFESCAAGVSPFNDADGHAINANAKYNYIIKNMSSSNYSVVGIGNFLKSNSVASIDRISFNNKWRSAYGDGAMYYRNISSWYEPDTDKISYAFTGNFSFVPPPANTAPNVALSVTSPILISDFGNVSDVILSLRTTDDYNATNTCSVSFAGFSYTNSSVLNNTLTLVKAINVSYGNYAAYANCSDTQPLTGFANTSFEVKRRLFINETLKPLVCPSDSVPDSILFVFIGLSMFIMIGLNEVFIRIPVINAIIGVGAMTYGYTLIGCTAIIGVIFIIFGIFSMLSSFIRGFS